MDHVLTTLRSLKDRKTELQAELERLDKAISALFALSNGKDHAPVTAPRVGRPARKKLRKGREPEQLSTPAAVDHVLSAVNSEEDALSAAQIARVIREEIPHRVKKVPSNNAVSAAISRCADRYGWQPVEVRDGWRNWWKPKEANGA